MRTGPRRQQENLREKSRGLKLAATATETQQRSRCSTDAGRCMTAPEESPRLFAAAVAVSALALVALARMPVAAPAPQPVRAARAAASKEGATRLRVGEPLDLNRAGLGDLLLLPGVGPKLAARILEERDRRAGFGSVEQLGEVKGVGPKKLAQLRALVTVEVVRDPGAMPP
jgi:competence protein ComEA